ncbi:MAG: hypothetical protein MI748_12015 [Opitutales bacterium]|nr:hypothetical protein [Opitutales bacterium]
MEGNEGPWSDFKYIHVTNADSARCVTNIESWLANLYKFAFFRISMTRNTTAFSILRNTFSVVELVLVVVVAIAPERS